MGFKRYIVHVYISAKTNVSKKQINDPLQSRIRILPKTKNTRSVCFKNAKLQDLFLD